MGGFWIAAFTRNFYGGLFVDPNLEISVIMGFHPNIFAFIFERLFLTTYLQFMDKYNLFMDTLLLWSK